jgi:phosphatidylinositol alpha-mannosyltransferase
VASDLPVFRSVAGDGAAFAPVGDPPALAAAIIDLLTDPPRREALAERGMTRARMFGRDVVLKAYLAAYRDAIGM